MSLCGCGGPAGRQRSNIVFTKPNAWSCWLRRYKAAEMRKPQFSKTITNSMGVPRKASTAPVATPTSRCAGVTTTVGEELSVTRAQLLAFGASLIRAGEIPPLRPLRDEAPPAFLRRRLVSPVRRRLAAVRRAFRRLRLGRGVVDIFRRPA